MTNQELAEVYFSKAKKLKIKIAYLHNELIRKSHYLGKCDKLEMQRRLRILYEMYLDLKSVGNTLTEKAEGDKNAGY